MKPERIQPPQLYFFGAGETTVQLGKQRQRLDADRRLVPVDPEVGRQLAAREGFALLARPADAAHHCGQPGATLDLDQVETCSPAGSADTYVVLSPATREALRRPPKPVAADTTTKTPAKKKGS